MKAIAVLAIHNSVGECIKNETVVDISYIVIGELNLMETTFPSTSSDRQPFYSHHNILFKSDVPGLLPPEHAASNIRY